jgi:hypothetical protein
MADQPTPPKPEETFNIPQPKIKNLGTSDTLSLSDAALEFRGFLSRDKSALTQTWWNWFQPHLLKWILFAFVVCINVWWTRNVLKMVWQSGSKGNYFHLDNDVLITLVSTSIASFLGLVAIVAKNLFPDSSK